MSAIGLLHLGVDRVLKYGLKYDHSFIVTHLGVHGPHRHHWPPSRATGRKLH